ncbi:hypothetical protein ACTXT7_016815 [Hymenolepis weldensis]
MGRKGETVESAPSLSQLVQPKITITFLGFNIVIRIIEFDSEVQTDSKIENNCRQGSSKAL